MARPDEAQRMKGLVEDLLTLTQLDEAGQTAPMPDGSVDLSDAVTGELLTFEPVAFERGVELESDVAPGVTVRGDAAKLKQLTAILIDNACKYAGLGGRVGYVKLARRDGRIQLSVTNTGDVIPPKQLSHVFERFYRADKARTGGKSGYGLGLAIAAGVARLHGGDIAATSDAEHGTVFSVTLPGKIIQRHELSVG